MDRRPVLEAARVGIALQIPGGVEKGLDQARLLQQIRVLVGGRRAVMASIVSAAMSVPRSKAVAIKWTKGARPVASTCG